jgi:hypothetical protein
MITGTLTTIENQFFEGLKAVQEPTVEAARRVAALLGQLTLLDSTSTLTAALPSAQEVVTRNVALAQRLFDNQRDFALELAGITLAPAKASKKSTA